MTCPPDSTGSVSGNGSTIFGRRRSGGCRIRWVVVRSGSVSGTVSLPGRWCCWPMARGCGSRTWGLVSRSRRRTRCRARLGHGGSTRRSRVTARGCWCGLTRRRVGASLRPMVISGPAHLLHRHRHQTGPGPQPEPWRFALPSHRRRRNRSQHHPPHPKRDSGRCRKFGCWDVCRRTGDCDFRPRHLPVV
jgi:hypothetical protein